MSDQALYHCYEALTEYGSVRVKRRLVRHWHKHPPRLPPEVWRPIRDDLEAQCGPTRAHRQGVRQWVPHLRIGPRLFRAQIPHMPGALAGLLRRLPIILLITPLRVLSVMRAAILARQVLHRLVLLILGGLLIAGGMSVYLWYQLPNREQTLAMASGVHFIVAKRAGEELSVGSIRETRQNFHISLENISPHLIHAIVASEDRRFFWDPSEHAFYEVGPIYRVGRFVQSAARCFLVIKPVNLVTGRTKRCPGGSSISQQLAKNLLVSTHRTPFRKVLELLWALKIDEQLERDEILRLYLNRLNFGSANYGPEMGARYTFGRRAKHLSAQDAALLAAAVSHPERNWRRRPAQTIKRARVLLCLMFEEGYVEASDLGQRTQDLARRCALVRQDTLTEAEKVEVRKILPSTYRPRTGDMEPPNPYTKHLWMWLQPKLQRLLAERPAGLYQVVTTLDAEMQVYAERALEQRVRDAQARGVRVSQGAVLSMRPDGRILAMVGGVGDAGRGANRVRRPPGWNERPPSSTFKPVIFLAALEQGLKPDSLISTAPISVPLAGGGEYRPRNWDGRYGGRVTLTDALRRSVNTATLRLLYEQVKLPKAVATARRLGIQAPGLDRADWSLALGTHPISLEEMTTAYAYFANGGLRVEPRAITAIYDVNARLISRDQAPASERRFSAQTIDQMNAMLTKVVESGGTGTRAAQGFDPGKVAGKTGTSNDARDAWFIGFTADLVTGIWVGNDGKDGLPSMQGVSGATLPAEIWNAYLWMLKRYSPALIGELKPLVKSG